MERRRIQLINLALVLSFTLWNGVPAWGAPLTVIVPGTSDPWLAGMTSGSRASSADTAPSQSPIEVVDARLMAGTALTFSAAGLVANGTCGAPYCPSFGPDGGIKPDEFPMFHGNGAENGIADLGAPINSLVGVFLDERLPALSSPPATLDFNPASSQNYRTLSPAVKQPFFIGDGLADGNVPQRVIVPSDATRLFLGTMDGCCWSDNQGFFTVSISEIPEPSVFEFLSVGMLLLGFVAVREFRTTARNSE